MISIIFGGSVSGPARPRKVPGFAPGVGISRLFRSDGLGVQNVFCFGRPSGLSRLQGKEGQFVIQFFKMLYCPWSSWLIRFLVQ